MCASRRVLGLAAVGLLSLAPGHALRAADADQLDELKRAIEALREENRALSRRLSDLEAEKARRGQGTDAAAPTAPADGANLERRVQELETAKTAQEDATRSIIRQSLSTLGSKINETMSLGGTLEVTGSRTRDFAGQTTSALNLSSANLEFDIQATDWVLGRFRIEYTDGTNVVFPTNTGAEASVDRINLDQAYFTIGDTQRFPPYLTAGRLVLPFGISTGRPVTDTLSIVNPLTVEVFETKQTAVGLGVSFPTPALKPPTPPILVPTVRPIAVNPLVSALSRRLGYDPPPLRPKPLPPVVFPPEPPPFDAAVYFYESQVSGSPRQHVNATAGWNARGNCGRSYDLLYGFGPCPWAVNFDVNYNSSIFDAQFLRDGYQPFLAQIGMVPAMAASVKAVLGPWSVVGEWNGATKQARFTNGLGNPVGIKPSAWQASIGFQFDWNPWVQEIGAQGTYVAITYSQSSDLAGTTALVNGAPTRVGFVPKRRLSITAGEWVLDSVRLAVEYDLNRDYPVSEGGTGRDAPGFFVSLVYAF